MLPDPMSHLGDSGTSHHKDRRPATEDWWSLIGLKWFKLNKRRLAKLDRWSKGKKRLVRLHTKDWQVGSHLQSLPVPGDQLWTIYYIICGFQEGKTLCQSLKLNNDSRCLYESQHLMKKASKPRNASPRANGISMAIPTRVVNWK